MEAWEILERIRRERDVLRRRVEDAVELARRVLSGENPSDADLHRCAEALQRAMLHYIDLEDELLPQVLRNVDAWGPARVEQMRREHAERRRTLQRVVEALDARPHDHVLAAGLLCELAAQVLVALADEDDHLLCEDVLEPPIVRTDVFTG